MLQVALGANAVTKTTKGNNKLAAFESSVVFGRKVTLHNASPPFVAASISLLGISAAGADCLIYDFLGPNTAP